MLRLARHYSSNKGSRLVLSLKNPSLFKTQGYINGEWVNGSNTLAVNDPGIAPNEDALVAEVQAFSNKEYEHAIRAAHESFQTFRKTTGRYRAGLLRNLYELMMENQEDLAKLIVYENGKPYADAFGEVAYSASYFQWFSEEAARLGGDIIPSQNATSKILAWREPVGVCGFITPWNFPSAMIGRKLGAAVAAGCTSVTKPPSETPLSALALAYLLHEAGFPKGVNNVLPSTNAAEASKILCEHPLVSKISSTGSTRVGKLLASQSASSLKKLSLELGGNAPFIVFEDADLSAAVDGAIASKFRSSGQTCVCANRLLVHESIYDEFAAALVAKLTQTTVLGHGMDKKSTHGPVIHDRSMSKVREHIEDATKRGAKVLLGGNKRPDLGVNYHELTVLGDVTPEMEIFHEETFGPVAPLIKFGSDEEAIELANDTELGLASYFFSKDYQKVFKIAAALDVGMIGVNTGIISEAALPFGGVHESGYGREGSKFGIEDYTVVKSVVLGGMSK